MKPITTSASRRRPASLRIKIAFAAVIVVAMVGGVYLLGGGSAKRPSVPQPPASPVAVAPSTAPVVTRVDMPRETPQEPPALEVATNAPQKRYEKGVEVVSSTVRTNDSGAVIEKLVLADGRKMSKVEPPKPVFDNPSDQVLALAIGTNPGDAMPPLPDLTGIDEDFAKSLLTPIVINEDDTDEVKALKEAVAGTRAYIAEEVKKGRSVMEVLMEHQAEMERLERSRLSAVLRMQAIYGEQGLEAAQKYAREVNKVFAENGMPEIPVIGEQKNRHN